MKKAPLLFEDRPPDAPAPPSGRSLGRGLWLIVLIFVATRLVTWTGAYVGAAMLFCIRNHWEPFIAKRAEEFLKQPPSPESPEYRSAIELFTDLAPLNQFDAGHYKSIIEHGYEYAPPAPRAKPQQHNIAFFPLYPLLCRPLTGVLSAEVAQVVVAQVCALTAGILLYLWARWRIAENAAIFAVATVFCLPAACYYSFGYAESVTLLTLVGALWLMDRRAFVPAAIVCGLATASRPTALGIVPVYLLAYWFNHPAPPGRRLARLVPLALVATAGILAYAGYLTWRFGSPLVYLANFKAWVAEHGRADWVEFLTLAPVWERFKYLGWVVLGFPAGVIHLANPFTWNMPLNCFILFLSLAGLGRVPRSFRPLLLLGPFIFLHSYLASGGAGFGLDPIARYMAMSVPAFVVLAAWCTREWSAGARHALLTFMLLLQAVWAFRFGLREWSG